MSLPPGFAGAGPSKVPIPRLTQKRNDPPRKPSVVGTQKRVVRACLNCRSRKIKCDGVTPKCYNCSDLSGPCVYVNSRKDRLKTSTTQNQDMITLLGELRAQVAESYQSRIDDMLATVVGDVNDATATLKRSWSKLEPGDEEEQGEANVSAEVGSSGDLDLLDEDLLKDEQTRATGFIGKASEIQWLRGLHSHEEQRDGPFGQPGETDEAVSSRLSALRQRQDQQSTTLIHTNQASYFLDDDVFELDLEVAPYELPSFDSAEKLMQVYFESCHNSFPFLVKKTFSHQFYHYYAALRRGKPYDPPRKWQAQLNLVFAIGAVYSHLTLADWQGDERDHLIYHSRAWSLSLGDPWWFSHPDLPQMQTTGLLSFYYLSIGHINRSWVLIGMALRFGYALGLHVRNEDRTTDAARKEQLVRVWWGHYALERHLATITGRPSVGLNSSCSVPLPLPLSSPEIEDTIIESRFGDRVTTSTGISAKKRKVPATDSPHSDRTRTNSEVGSSDPTNSGSYLKNIVKWGEITQNALDLYRASTVGESWQYIQNIIAQLTEELEAWANALPEGFLFFKGRSASGHHYERERNTLEILYYSTRILVTRPCLCRLDRRIRNQTARSSAFNQRAALACVDSAKYIARLLPDNPEVNLQTLYQCGPWWSMVHTIMQSLVVLLLEITFDARNFPEDRQEVVAPLKKLVRWLRAMSPNNRIAKRAYSIVINLIRKLYATIPMDISELLNEDDAANAVAAISSSPPREARGRGAGMGDTSTLYPHINETPSVSMSVGRAHQARAQYNQTQYNQPLPVNTNLDPMMDVYRDPASQSNRDTPTADYTDMVMEPWGSSEPAFPALFFTSFDELNPLPGFGLEDLEGITFEGTGFE